jgi:hypothetical protein
MTAPSEKAALSRELADFLIELSIALHKHAMYPEGHPSLDPAAAGVTRRAEHLFEARATLALGVARQQLVIEGVATDPKNPLLSELAGRLHRHHLGAVTFHRGLRVTEVVDVLKTLAVEAERTGEPLGLGPPEQLRAWDHIRLHPVTYDRLALLQDDDHASVDEKGAKERGLRSAQLWVGLARAALTAGALASDDTPPAATEPSVIAKAIDEHPKSAAYDQVIVGYLLQIADELKHTGGAEAVALRRRTSKLVGALQPRTLRRLIEMGGDAAQRTKFAIDATHALAVDAVLEIVRAMADAAHKTVSDPLVRMLSKLAQHAEQGTAEARPQADEALRDQVRGLLEGWTLEDPNPDAYASALQKIVAASPATSARSAWQQPAEPLRIVQTALETGVLGFGAWRAIERLVAEHHVGDLVDLLTLSPPPSTPDVGPLWTRVTSPDEVRELASTEPPDFATLDRVLPRLPADGFEPLLDVLGESESRTTRRGLLDRLTRAPRELGPVIATRLTREIPWYVTRNLLLILDGLPGLPDGFRAAAFIAHEDARVRREALKVSLKVPAEREPALLGALRDGDPRMVRVALTAALEDCPVSALPLITQIVHNQEVASELRVLAIKVLGRVRNVAGLAALLAIADGGTTWLGRPKLAARSLELLAALMALAAGWRNDGKAAALLALAAASNDPDIRNAASATPRTTAMPAGRR